jgi:CobQ-like glutamine amidotransferase family enzyme
MSTYGDRGNVICLRQRAEWRGIQVNVLSLAQDTPPEEFQKVDVLVVAAHKTDSKKS